MIGLLVWGNMREPIFGEFLGYILVESVCLEFIVLGTSWRFPNNPDFSFFEWRVMAELNGKFPALSQKRLPVVDSDNWYCSNDFQLALRSNPHPLYNEKILKNTAHNSMDIDQHIYYIFLICVMNFVMYLDGPGWLYKFIRYLGLLRALAGGPLDFAVWPMLAQHKLFSKYIWIYSNIEVI